MKFLLSWEETHPMFERLINSFGRPANQQDGAHLRDGELQLAAAVLLFGVMPVDHRITNDETSAFHDALVTLFNYSPEKCRRMMARAASAHARDSSIVAATTLLKRRSPEHFRRRLMQEVRNLTRADGTVHDNEIDLEQRIERLLGLAQGELQISA
jgi:uncharacterized tellurite resistance protein B-like protein